MTSPQVLSARTKPYRRPVTARGRGPEKVCGLVSVVLAGAVLLRPGADVGARLRQLDLVDLRRELLQLGDLIRGRLLSRPDALQRAGDLQVGVCDHLEVRPDSRRSPLGEAVEQRRRLLDVGAAGPGESRRELRRQVDEVLAVLARQLAEVRRGTRWSR